MVSFNDLHLKKGTKITTSNKMIFTRKRSKQPDTNMTYLKCDVSGVNLSAKKCNVKYAINF